MKNILFLSFIKYKTINVHDFYADILRNYVKDIKLLVMSLD